jgi:hypothetical protein
MSEQAKHEPVELLDNDDDIRSIAGSEWTVDTRCTDGEQNVSKKELILKMRILEVKG